MVDFFSASKKWNEMKKGNSIKNYQILLITAFVFCLSGGLCRAQYGYGSAGSYSNNYYTPSYYYKYNSSKEASSAAARFRSQAESLQENISNLKARLRKIESKKKEFEREGLNTRKVDEAIEYWKYKAKSDLERYDTQIVEFKAARDKKLAELENQYQRAQIPADINKQNNKIRKIKRNLAALKQEKATVLRELRQGLFCSECDRSKFEIEKQTNTSFEQHLVDVSGRPIAKPEKVRAKENEYNRKIENIINKIPGIENEIDRIQKARSDKIDGAYNKLEKARQFGIERLALLKKRRKEAEERFKKGKEAKLEQLKKERERTIAQYWKQIDQLNKDSYEVQRQINSKERELTKIKNEQSTAQSEIAGLRQRERYEAEKKERARIEKIERLQKEREKLERKIERAKRVKERQEAKKKQRNKIEEDSRRERQHQRWVKEEGDRLERERQEVAREKQKADRQHNKWVEEEGERLDKEKKEVAAKQQKADLQHKKWVEEEGRRLDRERQEIARERQKKADKMADDMMSEWENHLRKNRKQKSEIEDELKKARDKKSETAQASVPDDPFPYFQSDYSLAEHSGKTKEAFADNVIQLIDDENSGDNLESVPFNAESALDNLIGGKEKVSFSDAIVKEVKGQIKKKINQLKEEVLDTLAFNEPLEIARKIQKDITKLSKPGIGDSIVEALSWDKKPENDEDTFGKFEYAAEKVFNNVKTVVDLPGFLMRQGRYAEELYNSMEDHVKSWFIDEDEDDEYIF